MTRLQNQVSKSFVGLVFCCLSVLLFNTASRPHLTQRAGAHTSYCRTPDPGKSLFIHALDGWVGPWIHLYTSTPIYQCHVSKSDLLHTQIDFKPWRWLIKIWHRYHSAATLKTMKAYRIGRKPAGLWFNRTPPIRGGIFHKQAKLDPDAGSLSDTEEDSIGEDGTSSSITSLDCSCVGTVHVCGEAGEAGEPCLRKRCPPQDQSINEKAACVDEEALHRVCPSLTRTQFSDLNIQQNADLDAQSYPSLDPTVQEDIVQKYRELHQKVLDQGLYNCPYIDYGKEMARYSALFLLFAVFLTKGWYLTSSVFLGLFWVSLSLAT